MSISPIEYLHHILNETSYKIDATRGVSEVEYSTDETLKRALVRSIEIIGEATKKLPQEFKDTHPHIEWRSITGMRDRLIHDYLGVDYEIVWDVVTNKIPTLRSEIQNILKE